MKKLAHVTGEHTEGTEKKLLPNRCGKLFRHLGKSNLGCHEITVSDFIGSWMRSTIRNDFPGFFLFRVYGFSLNGFISKPSKKTLRRSKASLFTRSLSSWSSISKKFATQTGPGKFILENFAHIFSNPSRTRRLERWGLKHSINALIPSG